MKEILLKLSEPETLRNPAENHIGDLLIEMVQLKQAETDEQEELGNIAKKLNAQLDEKIAEVKKGEQVIEAAKLMCRKRESA